MKRRISDTMQKPIVSIIAAMSLNRVIGKGGAIPWHISEDSKYFKEKTTGHAIIMGRATFQSLGRPLPNRTNIVITRDTSFQAPGCIICGSLEKAIEKAKAIEQEEIFIIGGGQVYAETIGIADKLYLTLVHKEFTGDAFFPDYTDFKIVSKRDGASEGLQYSFLELERKVGPAAGGT